MVQLAAGVQHRLAGGQGRLGGVDEAAAIAGDAVGVGDDHVGGLAGHLGVAVELAAVVAGDLVEDGAGGVALEVAVAQDDAAQLSALGAAGGVVEDQPLAADVVVAELVVRQAAGVGRGDVDDRHAVGGRGGGGALPADRKPPGLGPQRLPEQGVGQHEGQAAFGDAPETLARLNGSRRLAGQEGQLAYVHVQVSQAF